VCDLFGTRNGSRLTRSSIQAEFSITTVAVRELVADATPPDPPIPWLAVRLGKFQHACFVRFESERLEIIAKISHKHCWFSALRLQSLLHAPAAEMISFHARPRRVHVRLYGQRYGVAIALPP